MCSLWKNHSLSITLGTSGLMIMAICIPIQEGVWFDLISQLGGGLFTGAVIGFASGPLRERNKPDT